MAHTLDVSKLEQIFDELWDNAHKLDTWEADRLEEWYPMWQNGYKFSDAQLEKIEKMYQKV
jgi:hypothetical protein